MIFEMIKFKALRFFWCMLKEKNIWKVERNQTRYKVSHVMKYLFSYLFIYYQ